MCTINNELLFDSYSQHINCLYPDFLKRVGYRKIAGHAVASNITDSSGNTYLDCIAGYGLFCFGHNNPEIVNAVKKVLDQKILLTKPFIVKEQVKAAEDFERICPGELSCSFMCNSGSEAVDTAIKLARFHTGQSRIICAEKSFYGYTFGALSASGIDAFKQRFLPLVPDIFHVEYGNIEALKKEIDNHTAAILLEPVQHEAGVLVPSDNYLREVRRLCDHHGVLLILDEIKTGLGRTGKMFGCNHSGVVPDIMLLGKALGGGLIPTGAVIAKKKIWRRTGYSFPLFASSYAGNTLASAAASAVINILENTPIVSECAEKGQYLHGRLNEIKGIYPDIIKQVDGKGLLLSVSIADSRVALKIVRHLAENRILTAPAFGNPSVIMIEPPLVITCEEIDKIFTGFEKSCKEAIKNG